MSLPDASPGAPSLDRGEAGGTYLASVSVKLRSLQPEAVLAAPAGGVRGFWQSGPHWVAHAGVAAEIDAREWDGEVGDRFAGVKERARRLFDAPWIRDLDGVAGRPRLHGGFAFHTPADLESEPGFWEAFPPARFVLPAFEVEADDRGARLTVTRRFPASTPGDSAIDQLRRRADRTREQLSELDGSGAAPGPIPAATALESPVGPEVWREGIERILAAIDSGEVRKVVLARPLDVTLTEPPDSSGVLASLRKANPLAHTYLLQFATDRFLLGAAPELVGSLWGRRFRTMAVGGSNPRGSDPESDAWLGRQLLGSRKNRVEHRIVVEGIVADLAAAGVDVTSTSDTALLRLPRIQHLRTELEARVPAGMHVLDLVGALHPTAAVCGDPREAAYGILEAGEPMGRGWYAGPVGWFDEDGQGEFAPALRSGVCRGPLLRLYAGAGIVRGSHARSEWEETRVKLQTMLAALGVERVP